MEVDFSLDIDRFIRPIADGQPCGADLSRDRGSDSLFSQVKLYRDEARNNEKPPSSAQPDDKTSQEVQSWHNYIRRASTHWKKVADLSADILERHSKDLRVAVWYTEALIRTDGFAGLGQGIRLIRRLLEDFWPGLHPQPEEGEAADATLSPLGAFDNTRTSGILFVLKTLQLSEGSAPICRISLESSAVPDADRQAAARETSPQFFSKLREQLDACLEETGLLRKVLRDKCSVGTAFQEDIDAVLKDCRDEIRMITGDSDSPIEKPSEKSVPSGQASGRAGADFSSREDALMTVLRVAKYFRQVEPHSPVAYQLERAVRWGRMSLQQLLSEVIPNDDARRKYQELTGVVEAAEKERKN